MYLGSRRRDSSSLCAVTIQSRTRESNVAGVKIGTVLGIVCWISIVVVLLWQNFFDFKDTWRNWEDVKERIATRWWDPTPVQASEDCWHVGPSWHDGFC